MALMEWSNEISVGIDAIDDDHKKLLWKINELDIAMISRRGKVTLKQMLGEVLAIATEHFQLEEEIMKMYNYPETMIHMYQHEEFKTELVNIISRNDPNSAVVTLATIPFLHSWTVNHIQKTDQKLADFLKQKGF